MENPIDILNVPAFKRKRSIAARARKTSGEIRMSDMRPSKKPRARTRRSRPIFDEPIMDLPLERELEEETYEPETIRRSDEKGIRKMKNCGQCEGYFDRINVAVVKLTTPLRAGDSIIFETAEGLFEQPVESMQIDHKDVRMAKSGSDIGLKVVIPPKVGGSVYKVL
jgi:putative protease